MENQENKRGRGRPKKIKDTHLMPTTIRFTEEETGMIEELQRDDDETRTDIVRKALKTYYYMKKNPNFFRN